ncbi:uncharacterized protein LOC129601077 [Paramacrobiotus metropolitanus]|uniref:uncharacterized protein LOC129601077 n=1 Tax=Paramacrobiotus metropolitanus TaxID=2943436 RepID=UPI0024460CFD|nr:uncharacterized protein LOC129601077 [Paramacrobiotus metropolitanus]
MMSELTLLTVNGTGCAWPERNFQYIYQFDEFKYTELILHPIWLFLCTVGEVLNIILLRKVETFQAMFVTAVAHFDLLAMWGFLLRSLQVYFGLTNKDEVAIWGIENNVTSDSLKAFLVSCQFIGNIGTWYSDWILVGFSITRLMFTIDPIRWRLFITRKQIRIAILCCFPLISALSFYPIIEFITLHDSAAQASWAGKWRQFNFVSAGVGAFASFLLILITNMIIAMILCRRHRNFRVDVGRRQGSRCMRVHGNDSTISTTMPLLTASVVIHLVTTIPYVSWYVVLALERSCRVRLTDEHFAILQSFFIQFLYPKYSLNFFVYCGVSRTFLKRFLHWAKKYCWCNPEVVTKIVGVTTSVSDVPTGGTVEFDLHVCESRSDNDKRPNH